MDERAARAVVTAFGLGLVIGVAVGLLFGPPPITRVVRFVDLPPAPDQLKPVEVIQ